MKWISLLLLSCVLTGCAFTKDYVEVSYQPSCAPQRIRGAETIEVTVHVNDTRTKENVGCKINGYGIEAASIIANNDLVEVVRNAITWELEERGFVIAYGGHKLSIELCKLYNDFKPGWFCAKADAETVFNIVLKNKEGTVVYAKTIMGLGKEETCFFASGKNANLALQQSLRAAIQKLMNDREFIQALFTE